jgi:acetyl-CoA acetyltransferase
MTWQLWFEELFESTAIDPELIDKVILGCANQVGQMIELKGNSRKGVA